MTPTNFEPFLRATSLSTMSLSLDEAVLPSSETLMQLSPVQRSQHSLDLSRFILSDEQTDLITSALRLDIRESAVTNLVTPTAILPVGGLRAGGCAFVVLHAPSETDLVWLFSVLAATAGRGVSELHFTDAELGSSHAEALPVFDKMCSTFSNMSTLTSLSLLACKLRDKDVEGLAQALALSPSFTRFFATTL